MDNLEITGVHFRFSRIGQSDADASCLEVTAAVGCSALIQMPGNSNIVRHCTAACHLEAREVCCSSSTYMRKCEMRPYRAFYYSLWNFVYALCTSVK